MSIQVLKMDEVDSVSGGLTAVPFAEFIQPQPECFYVGEDGKCEDIYTTPPTIPPVVIAYF